jgi:Protein kinase domain
VARAGSALALIVGVGAGVGLWLASAGKPATGPSHADGVAAADAIADALRGDGKGAHERAVTLAQLPRLQAAVATDAATVRDLTTEELMFRPQPKETIELGQIVDGKARSLLRLPETSPVAAPLGQPGMHLQVAGDALILFDVEQVTPTQGEGSMMGALAVSRTIDKAELAGKLDKLGGGARLEVGGGAVALGTGVAAGARTETFAIDGAPDGATLIGPAGTAAVPASTPLRGGAAACAVLGLLGAVLLGRKRGAAATGAAATTQAPMSTATPVPGTIPGVGTAATQLGAATANPTGSPFGRYQPVRLLGSGGMADVYLARSVGEAGFEKQVALKIMHSHLGRVEEAVAHFLDEARLASRLSHPNIVHIYDLGRNGDDYFIAMEYIDGTDLERVIHSLRAGGRQVPVAIGLGILRKVCDGLHAAHTATDGEGRPLGLVHRDVKSANVLISKDGAVKIADFGIVKAEQQLHKTSVGQAKGTLAFMAPEQRMGAKVDARADVFGVGALGYELMTALEVNLDLVAMLQRGVDGWPHLPVPTQARPDLPPELDAILFRALAFEADQRYPSCAALENDLAHVAKSRGLVATDKEIAHWIGAELQLLPRRSVESPAAIAPTGAV